MNNLRGILELGYVLAITQFKAQNEGSYLGILWYLLDPLLLFTVIVIARGAAFPADSIQNFPVYLLIGLLLLHLFTKTTSDAIEVVSRHDQFIKNMKISYEALVVSVVLKRLFTHLFEIIILAGVMFFTGVTLLGLILYPFILLIFSVFLLGISFLLAPMGAYVRDFANLWSPLTRVLLFATPVFYAASPGTLTYTISLFNPVFHYMSSARSILIEGTMPPAVTLLGMIGFATIAFVVGIFVFSRTKHRFPELV